MPVAQRNNHIAMSRGQSQLISRLRRCVVGFCKEKDWLWASKSGDDLLAHTVASAVSSAQKNVTSVLASEWNGWVLFAMTCVKLVCKGRGELSARVYVLSPVME